jgi:hypothetical protein
LLPLGIASAQSDETLMIFHATTPMSTLYDQQDRAQRRFQLVAEVQEAETICPSRAARQVIQRLDVILTPFG